MLDLTSHWVLAFGFRPGFIQTVCRLHGVVTALEESSLGDLLISSMQYPLPVCEFSLLSLDSAFTTEYKSI